MKKTVSITVLICFFLLMFNGCSRFKITAEEDITYFINSGFFYTSTQRSDNKEERIYLDKRRNAVASFVKEIKKVADLSSDLIKGISKYEDKILSVIASMKDPDDETIETFKNLTEQMLRYKIHIEALEEESVLYIQAKTKNSGLQAIINEYMLSVVCEKISLQNVYLGWLVHSTGIVEDILEQTSQKDADRFVSSVLSIYEKNIMDDLKKMVFHFNKCGTIYAYIRSTDYIVSEYYFSKTENLLDELKGSEFDSVRNEIDSLESIFLEIKDKYNEPKFFKTLAKTEKRESIWTKTVYAADNEPSALQKVIGVFKTIGSIISAKDENDENNDQYRIDEKINSKTDSSQKGLFDFIGDTKQMSEESVVDVFERQLMISVIKAYQDKMKSFSENTDEQFEKILSMIADFIKDKKSALSEDKQKEIDDLLTAEFENLLGRKKSEFVDYILYAKADELIELFNEWKDKTKSLGKIEYNKANLINLLVFVGIINDFSIKASYEDIKEMRLYSENEDLLFLIYEWKDDLNYSKYKKIETKDDAGNLSGSSYVNDNNSSVGWVMRISENELFYSYYFPEEFDKRLEIKRIGTYSSNLFSSVQFRNPDGSISNGIEFRPISRDSDTLELYEIWSFKNDVKEGLNMQKDRDRHIVELYEEGNLMDSYIYKNDILIEEIQYQYMGPTVYRNVQKYYDSGKIQFIYGETGNVSDTGYISYQNDGASYHYYENGKLCSYVEYRDGNYQGELINNYEDGTLWIKQVYSDGVRNGLHLTNHPNGNPSITGKFENGEQEGVWYTYDEAGEVRSEIGYSHGIYDGVYNIYEVIINGEKIGYRNITGQYKNGVKTGIWIEDTNTSQNVVYYEAGRLKWTEKNNIRTYFNEDGSVKSTEKFED